MFAVFEVLEENEHNNGLLNFFFCLWSLGRGPIYSLCGFTTNNNLIKKS